MNLKLSIRSISLWVVLLIIVGLAASYLYFVFMASFSKSKGWAGSTKPGQTLPIMSNNISQECMAVFQTTTLTPYIEAAPPHIKHDYPEFKEYASVWSLDSASTDTYEAALLDHPACLGFILKRMSVVENRRILVIYDRATSSEVLFIRNYR